MSNLIINGKARGEFNLIVTRENGKTEKFKFHNLLLNNAFSSNSSPLNYCTVGTGTNPPTVTDTALKARLGTNISGQGVGSSVATTWVGSVATVSRKTTFAFGAGALIGNISELALYKSTVISSANILVRALVEDINGDPTTITLGAGDQLTVEHTLYVDIETRPAPTVMNINSIDYTVSVVVAYVDIYASSGTNVTSVVSQDYPELGASTSSVTIAEGVSVPAVGSSARPSYTGVRVNSSPTASYNNQPASGYNEVTVSATINTGEQLPSGIPIGGLMFGGNISRPTIAVLFSPSLPKNSSVGYNFALTARLTRA